MTQAMLRTVFTLTVGMFACACGEHSPVQIATAPSATPVPPIVQVTGPTLSGRVYEATPQGLRAVTKGEVWYVVEGGIRDGRATIDADGRYTIPALSTGARVRLTAFSIELQQTCAVARVFEGSDTVQDITLVREGTHDLS